MSRFQHTCALCQRSSKSAFRFAQCCECRRMICVECAETEEASVRTHLKIVQDNTLMWQDFKPHCMMNKKPWTWQKLCCVDCYNQKLHEAGILEAVTQAA